MKYQKALKQVQKHALEFQKSRILSIKIPTNPQENKSSVRKCFSA